MIIVLVQYSDRYIHQKVFLYQFFIGILERNIYILALRVRISRIITSELLSAYSNQYNVSINTQFQLNDEEFEIYIQSFITRNLVENTEQTPLLNSQIITLNELEENDNEDCPICLYSFTHESRIIRTNCNHVFDDECLNQWRVLGTSGLLCPICRTELN